MRFIFNTFFRKTVRKMILKELTSYDAKLALSLDKYMAKVLTQMKQPASNASLESLLAAAYGAPAGADPYAAPVKPKAPIGFHKEQI